MRLANLQEFRRMFYTPDSAPTTTTLRNRINQRQLPGGRKDGKRYVVDLDEYDRQTGAINQVFEQQRQAAKNPLLADLI